MSPRYAFLAILRAAFTLWLVVSIAFFALRLSGDPVDQILPDDAPPELIAHYTEAWGLDRSLGAQYASFWRAAAAGDLGQSFVERRDAADMVMERLPQTLRLMGASLLVALAIGLPAGILSALHRNTVVDRGVMTFAVTGHALPNFLLGILLIWLFAVILGWLPSSGRDAPFSIVLPALTLGTAYAGALARYTRGAVLEAMAAPHVLAARARGHGRRAIVMHEVLPNAAIPVVTVLGFMIGGLIGGATITESVFAWPGIGRLLINAVALRDFAVVQTIVLLITASMVTVNLAVDLAYGVLDPRVGAARARGARS